VDVGQLPNRSELVCASYQGWRDRKRHRCGRGSFEVLPVAAIVVQNLVIEADWSHDDTVTLQSSVNFGPFSLVGRTIDQAKNTLSCPGMQIVAWVFEPNAALATQ
jgi:hypothetical protein